MAKQVREININHIKPHPDNPRKDVGDITELAKSIKVNGIMQNLTVVPAAEGYKALIGHRRLAAAKKAGLESVPCVILEGLSLQEQIKIMLEENMQRQDLTIPEQAESFQLVLDLGGTIDDLVETTGFSETTIRHRLNLAKLDKELLQEAVHEYQFTLSDLIELEKVDDIETRNQILASARDHNQIVNKVAAAVREKKWREHAKKVIFLLEAMKIREAPEKTNTYDQNVNVIHGLYIEKGDKAKSHYTADHGGDIFYIDKSDSPWNPMIYVIEIFEPEKKKKPEPTQKELNERELKQELKGMESFRRMTIELVIEGKARYRGNDDLFERLYCIMEDVNATTSKRAGAAWMAGKLDWQLEQEEKELWRAKFMELPIETRMLITAECSAKHTIESIKLYDGTYDEHDGAIAMKYYELLKDFGHTTNKIYDAILDGSSHLYEK